MSALSFDPGAWVPLAVFTASLAGSAHCVGMCGGLVAATARTRAAWVSYHLGRLGGYLALGGGAGLVGSKLLVSGDDATPWAEALSWGATVAIGGALILSGWQVWKGRGLHVPLVPPRVLSWLHRQVGGRAWGVGALSALLPCGWLHAFLLGAAGTQSALGGAAFLLAFWLGTLPALGAAPWVTERFLRPLSRRSPGWAALLLVAAGLLSMGIKVAPLLVAAEPSCH
ncbi:MAG: sulfite exporter TauE/SafE family protein [Bdellovibrionales bacterium]|nr:sulfite exporter TauE/SafE family protein [Bdellovibrionales bacterium]